MGDKITSLAMLLQGAFHEIARRIPPQLQPPVYLLLHLCFCTTTCVIAWACWSRFALHSMLVVMCFTASLWHGGVYYFEVFAKRYVCSCICPRIGPFAHVGMHVAHADIPICTNGAWRHLLGCLPCFVRERNATSIPDVSSRAYLVRYGLACPIPKTWATGSAVQISPADQQPCGMRFA